MTSAISLPLGSPQVPSSSIHESDSLRSQVIDSIAFVYLIELERPLGDPEGHNAKYYLGCCKDLNIRLQQHRTGQGAKMLRAANERGISYRVVKFTTVPSFEIARELERTFKSWKNNRRLIDRDWSRYVQENTIAQN